MADESKASQPANPKRRRFLGSALAGVFAGSAGSLEKPARYAHGNHMFDTTQTCPAGTAGDLLINMALMNLVSDEFSQELKEFVSEKGEPLVRWRRDRELAVIDCGEGVSRAFKRMHVSVDDEKGGKAIAFCEVNLPDAQDIEQVRISELAALADKPIRVLFPGLSEKEYAGADNAAAHAILAGKRSPQIPFVDHYVRTLLLPALQSMRSPPDVQLFGHSLGAPNALHAKSLLQDNPQLKSCKVTLYEPLAAAGEAHHLTQEAGAPDKAGFIEALARDTTTVRSYPPTFVASLYPGNTVANMAFGEHAYAIPHRRMEDPNVMGKTKAALATGGVALTGLAKLAYDWVNDPRHYDLHREPSPGEKVTRRDVITYGATGVATTVLANLGDHVVGKAAQFSDQAFHDCAANACRLYQEGDEGLAVFNGKRLLPTAEQIQHPDRYTTRSLIDVATQAMALRS